MIIWDVLVSFVPLRSEESRFLFPSSAVNCFPSGWHHFTLWMLCIPALFKGNYCYCLMYLLLLFFHIHVIIIIFFIIYKMYIPGIYCSDFYTDDAFKEKYILSLCVIPCVHCVSFYINAFIIFQLILVVEEMLLQ